jgi:hypothetical protein
MKERPVAVLCFEILILLSTGIGLVLQIIVSYKDSLFAFIGAAITTTLALLISRGRKNWARWLLVCLFLPGAASMVWDISGTLAAGYPVLTIGIALLQALGLALLFTRQSSEWVRNKPSLKINE